jgi:hypothetical protein
VAEPLIDILRQTAEQLVIVERAKPWSVFDSLFPAVGAVGFLAMTLALLIGVGGFRRVRLFLRVPMSLLPLVPAFVFGFWAWATTSGCCTHQASFAKKEDLVLSQRVDDNGKPDAEWHVRLSSIRYATVETSRGDRRLVLITKSGESYFPLSNIFTDADGYYRVKDAINEFINAHPPP